LAGRGRDPAKRSTVGKVAGGVVGAAYGYSIRPRVYGPKPSQQQPQGGVCFVAGTQVKTADGFKPIEDVAIGDTVLSSNVETGEIGYKSVVNEFVKQTAELVSVKLDGETITATPEHPFFVEGRGWVAAGELTVGDKLVTPDGTVEILSVEREDVAATVYNFEVEDWHTYYVSGAVALVHNDCGTGIVSGRPANPKLLGGELLRSDRRKVNSQVFIDFIRSTGKSSAPWESSAPPAWHTNA
jgi:hypothetical protein